jgi:hypothetical protein
MTFALVLPAALSLLVLAAHFLRNGHLALVAASLVACALLSVRRPWAARTLQILLALGAAEWIRTLVALVVERQAEGRPFARMGAILGTVAFVSLLSAATFATRSLRARFRMVTV